MSDQQLPRNCDSAATRPATVTFGAAIAIMMCLMFGTVVVVLAVLFSDLSRAVTPDNPDTLSIFGAGLALVCLPVIGIVAAIKTTSGSSQARSFLTFLSLATALISITLAVSLETGDGPITTENITLFLWALFALLVVGLMFSGNANRWFEMVTEERLAREHRADASAALEGIDEAPTSTHDDPAEQ